jgi:hypothetical protein
MLFWDIYGHLTTVLMDACIDLWPWGVEWNDMERSKCRYHRHMITHLGPVMLHVFRRRRRSRRSEALPPPLGTSLFSFAVPKLLRHLIASFQLSVRKLRIRRLPVKGKVGLPYALYPTPDLAEGHPHVSPPITYPSLFSFFFNSTKASKPHIARFPVPRATPF